MTMSCRITLAAAAVALTTFNTARAADNLWCYQRSQQSGAPTCTYPTEAACLAPVFTTGGTCFINSGAVTTAAAGNKIKKRHRARPVG
jgi:hypothetical protein